jgi:AcrR family transcriptional regulator
VAEDSKITVGMRRPGGRATRVRSSVLRAAAELLSEVGYDQLSIEEVAERAGVHKTTVYRRWATKAALTTDAITEHSAEAVPVADTGSVVTDLQALARSVVANISSESGRRRASSLIVAAASSEELAAGLHDFWRHRIAVTAQIITRAVERGELPADTDANLVIETVIGPLWIRLLLTGEPLTDALADQVARLVATGACRA